jgi:Na+-transporting NADH:ubiquinone oxidoreductase subunit NqrC
LYAVELLNVNDKSDRSARAKELKKYFDAEIEPRLVPERTARFMLGEPTPVKVVEPKR